MSKFIVTYWTGATQNIDAVDIQGAANVAGYSIESNLINGIHIWDIDVDGTRVWEMTNSDGEKVATIEPDYASMQIAEIMDALDTNPWDAKNEIDVEVVMSERRLILAGKIGPAFLSDTAKATNLPLHGTAIVEVVGGNTYERSYIRAGRKVCVTSILSAIDEDYPMGLPAENF